MPTTTVHLQTVSSKSRNHRKRSEMIPSVVHSQQNESKYQQRNLSIYTYVLIYRSGIWFHKISVKDVGKGLQQVKLIVVVTHLYSVCFDTVNCSQFVFDLSFSSHSSTSTMGTRALTDGRSSRCPRPQPHRKAPGPCVRDTAGLYPGQPPRRTPPLCQDDPEAGRPAQPEWGALQAVPLTLLPARAQHAAHPAGARGVWQRGVIAEEGGHARTHAHTHHTEVDLPTLGAFPP